MCKEPGKKPLFSICVPLYNTEKYISKCIESVLNQKESDFELIIIDDGSTDRSGQIADSYARKDARVYVIHQENKGLFYTRIVGYEKSKGQFVLSLDADDFLELNALEKLKNKIVEVNPDIIIYNNYIVKGEHKRKQNALFSENQIWDSEKSTLWEKFILDSRINSIWRKVIRRECFDLSAARRQPARIKMGEDWVHSFFPMLNASKIVYINEPLINYRVFSKSLTAKYDYYYIKTLEIIYRLTLILLEKNEISLSMKDLQIQYVINTSKAIMYIYGYAESKVDFVNMLKDLTQKSDFLCIYKAVQKNVSMLYRIPIYLLKHNFFSLLFRFKNLISKIRCR